MKMRVGLMRVCLADLLFSAVFCTRSILFLGRLALAHHPINEPDQHNDTDENDEVGSEKRHHKHERVLQAIGRPEDMDSEINEKTG
jgi:hypothetical protein